MQVEASIANTEPRNISLAMLCAFKKYYGHKFIKLGPKISLLEIFRPRIVKLTSPYAALLSATLGFSL